MKKLLIALLLISFTLMIFSFLVYSTTANTVVNRLDNKLLTPVKSLNSGQDDSNTLTSQSVYNKAYDSVPPLSSSLLPSSNTFLKEPDKVVYITIDDGPDPRSTPQYLEVLKQHNVKATFFMIGSIMEKHPQLVLDMDSSGHAIGNHSYTHNYSSLYKNVENFTEEINRTEDIIYSITGKRPKIFRAPGGSTNIHKTDLIEKLDELGYAYFDWNVSSADTDPKGITKQEVLENIKRESRNLEKVIVLMHDNHKRPASVEALPELIEWFKKNGYEFGTLNEFVEPVHLKSNRKKLKIEKTVAGSVYSH